MVLVRLPVIEEGAEVLRGLPYFADLPQALEGAELEGEIRLRSQCDERHRVRRHAAVGELAHHVVAPHGEHAAALQRHPLPAIQAHQPEPALPGDPRFEAVRGTLLARAKGEPDWLLERRLAASDLAGLTATVPINLYRHGVQLQVEAGKVVGVEAVVHYACRDRNLLGMVTDLLGAHALGLRNLLLITGDPPKMGPYPEATAVFDIDSIGLTNLVNHLNKGLDPGGNPIGQPTAWPLTSSASPRASTGKAHCHPQPDLTPPTSRIEALACLAEPSIEDGRS
mgnify:CR=1 FL=1